QSMMPIRESSPPEKSDTADPRTRLRLRKLLRVVLNSRPNRGIGVATKSRRQISPVRNSSMGSTRFEVADHFPGSATGICTSNTLDQRSPSELSRFTALSQPYITDVKYANSAAS